jgi:hypothetical protein
MPTYDGKCSCGDVSFALASDPMFVNCCHCLDCQRQTGSAFVINALIETDRIAVRGVPQAISMPTDSGRPHDIYRCPRCQVAVWSDYGRRPKLRFVRVGTLVQPHPIVPSAHIFTRSKVPWVRIPDDQPAFEIFYELDKQWPAASLERRKAILG